jgi:hypothetical protein
VFAPSDFSSQKPPPPPLQENRTLGLLVLILLGILCVVMVVGMDSTVFIPYNATNAVTLTWQSQHPTTARPPNQPTTRSPQRTWTPNPALDQPIRYSGNSE